MKKLWTLVLLASLLCLGGCFPQPEPSAGPRMVTAITVTKLEDGDAHRFHYTNGEKLEVILEYLRFVDPYGRPDADPETVPGVEYRIELHYKDGASRTYRQKADRYLMTDGTWKTIKAADGEFLGLILEGMPGDG